MARAAPRLLTRDDMAAAAQVHRAAFDDRLPHLAGLHTMEEDRAFFRDRVFEACDVWGVEEDGELCGFIAFRADWIDHLYVLPAFQGRGVGGALLDVALSGRDEANLWTFQANSGARAFYERRGFVAVELTDGAGNEEREPDVHYFWSRHA